MSFVLFQAGYRAEPRTAARRIWWMIFTLVPLGLVAAMLITGAIASWIELSDQESPEPGVDLVGSLVLTVYGLVATVAWLAGLVYGVYRLREQRAGERHAREQRARAAHDRECAMAELEARRELRARESAAYACRRAAQDEHREARRRRR